MEPGSLTALLREVAAAPEKPGSKPASLSTGSVVGRYEIVRELGRGGFGVVYEARDRDLGRPVALKIVRPGKVAEEEGKVSREAEAIARLAHPNLITLFDVGRSEHGPYLVFELLRGKTLDLRIEEGPLPVQEAAHIATEVARGLAHAHAEGVVHRDLKPSNVFVTNKGQVKILDFGMAHAFGRRRVSGGTPAYMAPEQWEDAPEDERADVFALGVMLYRMLSGEDPFPEGQGRWSAEAATVPKLDVPGAPGLSELVEHMLDRTPTRRPRDGADALAALAPIDDALRAKPADGSPPVHVTRRRATLGDRLAELRRRRVFGVLVGYAIFTFAVLAIAAAGAGAWHAWQRAGERRSAPAVAPSIAVLPFQDLSPDHDQEYFSDGMAEEILSVLSRVKGLRVPGRASSFYFKGKNVEPGEIARKLRVAHLLEGSVRRSGSKLRISAEVVRASDGERLWGQTFDRDLSDVFAVQDEIARSVVRELAPMLLARTPPTAVAAAPDPEAYRLYLLGLSLFAQNSPRRALDALQRSTALDPRFAPAQATLAAAAGFAQVGARGEDFRQLGRAGREAAERAVVLDPSHPLGYVSRAWYRMRQDWDWKGASDDVDRAMAIDPANEWVLNIRSILLRTLGRTRESVEVMQRAVDLDPLNVVTTTNLAVLLANDGRLAEARELARRSLETAPGNRSAARALGFVALLEGQAEEALAQFELVSEPSGSAGIVAALHSLGRERESMDALARMERDHSDARFFIAGARAWRGDNDGAFAALDRAVEGRDPSLQTINSYPLLHPLHGDPRWKELLRKMNLPVD